MSDQSWTPLHHISPGSHLTGDMDTMFQCTRPSHPHSTTSHHTLTHSHPSHPHSTTSHHTLTLSHPSHPHPQSPITLSSSVTHHTLTLSHSSHPHPELPITSSSTVTDYTLTQSPITPSLCTHTYHTVFLGQRIVRLISFHRPDCHERWSRFSPDVPSSGRQRTPVEELFMKGRESHVSSRDTLDEK